jgi:hypothetical protein
MMLPILISVSDAPGSYFFWALAAVAVIAAIAVSAKSVRRRIIVHSRGVLFCRSVASRARGGKQPLIPQDETVLLRGANYD